MTGLRSVTSARSAPLDGGQVDGMTSTPSVAGAVHAACASWRGASGTRAERVRQRFWPASRRVRSVSHAGKHDVEALGHLDAAEERLRMDLPQVRDAHKPFRSSLFEWLKGESEVLEQLDTEMYARGLSTQDIEARLHRRKRGVPAVAHRRQRGHRSAVGRIRGFQNGICGIFRCCICSLTASTSPCACMAYRRKRCCAPGRLLPRGQGAVVVGSGQLGDFDVWLSFLRDLVSRGLPAPLTRCGPTAGAYAAEYIICAICATSNQRYPIISCPGSRRI